MTTREQIDQLIKEFANGNQSHFGKLIGAAQGTIGGWIARGNMDERRIKAALPQVDGNWLLTGMGDMLLPEDNSQSVSVKGDHNTTHVNSHNTTKCDEYREKQPNDLNQETQILQTKIEYLESLLEEKERLIKVLLHHS